MTDKLLTKKEAMQLLGISSSTLTRWMATGKIKFTKAVAEHFQSSVFFDRADIEPLIPVEPTLPTIGFAEVSVSDSDTHPKPKPAAEAKDIRTWAERFRDGDECDSCGNYIHGANERWPETGASLLGPARPMPQEPRPDTQSHMNPALITQPGPDGSTQYLNSLERQRDIGSISQEQYDVMTANASKANRMSQQERKVYLDRRAILEAFKFGYSR